MPKAAQRIRPRGKRRELRRGFAGGEVVVTFVGWYRVVAGWMA
jgi:hypothetical protein